MIRNLFVALAIAATSPAFATLAYSTKGVPYTQNFDSLATTGTNNAWTNDSTITGWFLFNNSTGTPVPVTSYLAGAGGNSTGGYYSYGSAGNSDRALGSTLSNGYSPLGSPGTSIAFAMTNNTGVKLDVFDVEFDGEQWQGGSTSTQSLTFQYGIGNSFASVAWTTVPAFTFNSPNNVASTAGLNGNLALNRVADLGGEIYIPAGLAPGQTLWLRWNDINDSGSDIALAIDNFSISAIPEPTAALFGSLLAGAFGLMVARRPAGRE